MSSSSLKTVATATFVAVVAVIAYFEVTPRATLPDVTLGHPVNLFPGLLSADEGKELRDLMHNIRVFPTNVQDVRHYTTLNEHIGEVCTARDWCPPTTRLTVV